MVQKIGKAKLAGRVLNTYVPLMEIQVQPLLRVRFFPACGFVAEACIEEMYSSSNISSIGSSTVSPCGK